MARRAPSNGVVAAQRRAQALGEEIPVPEGLRLANKQEKILWAQYSKMKLAIDWRAGDLVQLHEVVQLTTEIRKVEKEVKRKRHVIVDRFGTTREHPLVGVASKMRAQKQSLMRGLGLTVSVDGQAQKAVKKAAVSVADEQAAANAKQKPSLLAVS